MAHINDPCRALGRRESVRGLAGSEAGDWLCAHGSSRLCGPARQAQQRGSRHHGDYRRQTTEIWLETAIQSHEIREPYRNVLFPDSFLISIICSPPLSVLRITFKFSLIIEMLEERIGQTTFKPTETGPRTHPRINTSGCVMVNLYMCHLSCRDVMLIQLLTCMVCGIEEDVS